MVFFRIIYLKKKENNFINFILFLLFFKNKEVKDKLINHL